MKDRNSYTLAFLDLLFNTLLGITFMFILAFVLIEDPTEHKEPIKNKAEFIIQLDWDGHSPHDIDLWYSGPKNTLISYTSRQTDVAHLDRDDLGHVGDTSIGNNGPANSEDPKDLTGIAAYNPINHEIITIRQNVQGEHFVSVHWFKDKNWSGNKKPFDVTVSVYKLNPYKAIAERVVTLKKEGHEYSVVKFVTDKKGRVLEVQQDPDVSIVRSPRKEP